LALAAISPASSDHTKVMRAVLRRAATSSGAGATQARYHTGCRPKLQRINSPPRMARPKLTASSLVMRIAQPLRVKPSVLQASLPTPWRTVNSPSGSKRCLIFRSVA
jgi:hypothetical protein